MTQSVDIKKINSNINTIYVWELRLLCITSIFEIVFFPSWQGIYAICIAFFCLFIHKKTILNAYNLLLYPASTLAISFYVFFFGFLPIPATLLEQKPVTYNLHSTINTFSNILILEIILIFIHFIYKRLTLKRNFIREILSRLNFYTKVSSNELWILIIISSILWGFIILKYGLYTENNTNSYSELPIWIYLLNLLTSGYYSVLFIFMMPKFNIIKQPYTIQTWKIISLTIGLFIVGISTNMRTASVAVVANAFFLLAVYILYYPPNYKKFIKPKTIILSLLLVYFFTGPFILISNAMVEIRGNRSGKSGLEIIEMTSEYIQNSSERNYSTRSIKESSIFWDEKYLDNDILNRFCSVKILDETLFHAHRIGYANPIMQKYFTLKILDLLPGVVKKFFKINIPENIRSASLTDILYSLSINSSSAIGGIRIGTLQGLGLAIFGYWYILVLIPIFIIIFYFLDATITFNHKFKEIHFSLWFFANIISVCYYFSDRHYYLYEFRYILRTYFESIAFYLITINLIRKIPFIKH